MSNSNCACPACHYNKFSYSKKRGTWRCWACGYESNTPYPTAKNISLRKVYELLQPKYSGSLNLTGNERASIMKFIYNCEMKLKDSRMPNTIDPWMKHFSSW